MDSYKAIANSGIFYFLAIIVISFVLLQSIIFLLMAIKRGNKLGLTKENYKKAMVSGAMVSVVPSIATLIGFFSLAPVLGVPVSWTRLSIIGSLMVEATAASMGATAAGALTLGGANYTGMAFASSVWVMTIGTAWYLLSTTLFLKRVKKSISKGMNKDKKWAGILTISVIMGILSTFYMKPVIYGGQELITLLASSVVMVGFVLLMKKYKDSTFLKEFAMPLSMVGGMIFIVLYSM